MSVSAITPAALLDKGAAAPAKAAASTKATGAAEASQLAATENRFLSLLVAQMKNQDPLNPLDNAQVTSQMAQLSTVQGVNQMNAQLTQLLSEFQGLQAMTLAGRSVLVEGNVIEIAPPVAGSPVESRGGMVLGADATAVQVQVKDAAGKVVRTINVGARAAGISSFKWDGTDDAGKALAPGKYTFAVTATNGAKPVESLALAATRVEGVNRSAGGIQLDLGAAGIVSYADVLQVL